MCLIFLLIEEEPIELARPIKTDEHVDFLVPPVRILLIPFLQHLEERQFEGFLPFDKTLLAKPVQIPRLAHSPFGKVNVPFLCRTNQIIKRVEDEASRICLYSSHIGFCHVFPHAKEQVK